MLDVFLHAGFEVQTDTECGMVYSRFDIMPTESSRKALAVRERTRRVKRTGPPREAPGERPC